MNYILTAEIIGGILAGLPLSGLFVATLRAILGRKSQPWVVGDVPEAEKRASQEGYVHRCLVASDIACNVWFLRGQQDETISTHSWRAKQEGKLWGRIVSAWLNLYQPNHGERAASGDLMRALARVAVLKRALGVM